jgi:tight adherence protein C
MEQLLSFGQSQLMEGGAAGLPLLVGTLITVAILTVWVSMAPSRRASGFEDRLNEYLDRGDIVEAVELDSPFAQRAVAPVLRKILRATGAMLPSKNLAKIEEKLTVAGRPAGLTGLDFIGMRLLLGVALAGAGWFYSVQTNADGMVLLRNAGIGFVAGLMLPILWLRRKAKSRQTEVQRALPDALDMLTISVEAGLAFESAMLRVGEQWDNALSQEFRRAVTEMRLGKPRSEALRRMADRCLVSDLTTFVAILIQSNSMGVSIANVLHSQAEQMRIKRRQSAEERSRQASVKVVIVVALFILPSLFIVILGPAVPRILNTLGGTGG